MTEKIPQAQPSPAPWTTRLLRWRRNQLRRRTDVLRAWLGPGVMTVVLVTAAGAMLLVGTVVDDSLRQAAHEQAQSRQRTTAVLVHDAPQHPEPGSEEARYTRYPVEVRFTDPSGRTRTSEADVPPGLPAGGTVKVWSDDDGRLTEPPMTDDQIRSRTIGWIAATGIAVALTGAAVTAAIRLALNRRSLSRWDKAWADVAPRWTTRQATDHRQGEQP